MGLKLNGSSSGSVELNAPADTTSGADVVLTLPVNDGDANQFLQTNGSGTLTWATETTTNLTRGTAVATTSGSEIDFTSLPTGIRKLTVVLDEVGGDSIANIRLQLSTGSTFLTTGYVSSSARIQNGSTSTVASSTNSFVLLNNDNAAREWFGAFTVFNVTGNIWVCAGSANEDSAVRSCVAGGRVDLGGTLDGIRLTLTDSFDTGQVNIYYEV